MTVLRASIQDGRFSGLSTDTKPTQTAYLAGTQPYDVPQASTFFETDTGIRFFTSDGETWVAEYALVGEILLLDNPFGKGDLTSDGVQWSTEVTTSDANFKTVESITIEPPATGTIIQVEFGITYRIKSSSTAKHVKHKAQARNKGGTWVDLYAEVTRAADASSYLEVTYSGRFVPETNFNSVPFDVQVLIKREDAGENALAQVKSAGYIKVTYKPS